MPEKFDPNYWGQIGFILFLTAAAYVLGNLYPML